MLKVGLIGVSHWHLPNYLRPLQALPDVRVVAVSDPDPAVARDVADGIGADWSADYRELCDRVRPDFVFALGRHCDMAAQGEFLADRGLPPHSTLVRRSTLEDVFLHLTGRTLVD